MRYISSIGGGLLVSFIFLTTAFAQQGDFKGICTDAGGVIDGQACRCPLSTAFFNPYVFSCLDGKNPEYVGVRNIKTKPCVFPTLSTPMTQRPILSPKPTTDQCCVCQYMEVSACETVNYQNIYSIKNAKSICTDCSYDDSVQPDSIEEACNSIKIGTTRDCSWNSNNRKCESRFKKSCDQWIADPSNKDCNVKSVQPSSQPISVPAGQSCKNTRAKYDGHGQSCYTAGSRVIGCFSFTSDYVNFTEDSCGTFKDQDEVAAEVRRIQSRAGGRKVIFKASQATMTNTCNSLQTVTIDKKDISMEYGACKDLGYKAFSQNDCINPGETAICTDNQKKPIKKICCLQKIDPPSPYSWKYIIAYKGVINYFGWIEGDKCPD